MSPKKDNQLKNSLPRTVKCGEHLVSKDSMQFYGFSQHRPGVLPRPVTGHPSQVFLFFFKASTMELGCRTRPAKRGNNHGKSNVMLCGFFLREGQKSPKAHRFQEKAAKNTGTFYNTSPVPLKAHHLRQNHHRLQCSPKALQSLKGS